jgi:hypothetical protein
MSPALDRRGTDAVFTQGGRWSGHCFSKKWLSSVPLG